MIQKIPIDIGQAVGCAGGADQQVVQPDRHHSPHFHIAVVGKDSQGMAPEDLDVLFFQKRLVNVLVLVLP